MNIKNIKQAIICIIIILLTSSCSVLEKHYACDDICNEKLPNSSNIKDAETIKFYELFGDSMSATAMYANFYNDTLRQIGINDIDITKNVSNEICKMDNEEQIILINKILSCISSNYDMKNVKRIYFSTRTFGDFAVRLCSEYNNTSNKKQIEYFIQKDEFYKRLINIFSNHGIKVTAMYFEDLYPEPIQNLKKCCIISASNTDIYLDAHIYLDVEYCKE